MLREKSQSTLEYVLVLTAIIAAIIVAANAYIKPKVEKSLDHVTSEMQSQVNKIDFSTP